MVKHRTLTAIALTMVLALAGCAGSRVASNKDASGSSSGDGMIAQLTLPAEVDATAGGLVNYNPYSPKPLTKKWIYEPLMIQSSLSCEVTPWLATKYTWKSPSKLIFDVRQGVTWSDGQPFSAQDVAFTFNLAKKYPAMDQAGVWNDTFGAHADSVVAQDNQVIFTFSGNAAQKFGNIIKQPILPEHVYSKVGDPTKYVDKKPIGTGPFTVDSYNGRRLVLKRNPDYWQADKIKVQKLVLEGHYEPDQAVLKLRAGDLDYYSGEIPNPEKSFVKADPDHNDFWYAPNGITALAPNTTKAPFNDVKFREAMAYAVDKKSATQKATYGVMDTASQSGLEMPFKAKMLAPPYTENNTAIPYDPNKAEQLLDAAGYKKGADGWRTKKDGSPLKITLSVQAGWIDYEAIALSATADLRKVGLNVKVNKMSPGSVDREKKSGDFQMMVNYVGAGCQYATGLGATLASSQIPTKDTVLANVERFHDPKVDAAYKELLGTTDPARQKELVNVLVDTMMTKFPVIPVLYAPARMINTTKHAVGWPTEDNPYCNPQDNIRIIMTHLVAPH